MKIKEVRRRSYYDLKKLQDLIANPETRHITRTATNDATSLGYSPEEMVDLIMKLQKSNFCKTMEAHDCPGRWQDVYKVNDGSLALYIKIQKGNDESGVIISFKEDGS